MKWQEVLKKGIEALQEAKFSPDSICHHLGVVLPKSEERASIGLLCRSPSELLITMYDVGRQPRDGETLKRWREGIAELGKVVDEWNGEDGHTGISVVLAIEPNPGFLRAIANYRALPDVFHVNGADSKRFEAFTKEWDRALEAKGLFEARKGEKET